MATYQELPQDQWSKFGGGDANQTGQVNSSLDLFKQQFQNLLGRPPTQQELSGFANNALYSAWQAPGELTYGDESGLANSYIQNTFGPQAAQFSQEQQTNQLNQSQTQMQDLINKTMGNTATALSDPKSSIFQQLTGSMNNLGADPTSGAFQAGAGSTIANSGLNAANQGLTALGIPGIQGIAQTGQNPYQQSFGSGQTALGNLENLSNFGMQSDLAKQLAAMGQPSGAQSALGMATGSAQGAGSLLQGGSAAYNATSYICKELIKRDLLCASDMDDFHVHIMPAMFKKGRAFWKYAVDAGQLVDAVNERGLDWKVFKPLLFERVMEEPDACKAVDLYSDACHQLCISAAPELWDERVFRTGWLDSLAFLPRLLTYGPFIKALGKCVRIKTLIIYDKPRCEVHR